MNENVNQKISLRESEHRKKALKLVEEWLKELENFTDFNNEGDCNDKS